MLSLRPASSAIRNSAACKRSPRWRSWISLRSSTGALVDAALQFVLRLAPGQRGQDVLGDEAQQRLVVVAVADGRVVALHHDRAAHHAVLAASARPASPRCPGQGRSSRGTSNSRRPGFATGRASACRGAAGPASGCCPSPAADSSSLRVRARRGHGCRRSTGSGSSRARDRSARCRSSRRTSGGRRSGAGRAAPPSVSASELARSLIANSARCRRSALASRSTSTCRRCVYSSDWQRSRERVELGPPVEVHVCGIEMRPTARPTGPCSARPPRPAGRAPLAGSVRRRKLPFSRARRFQQAQRARIGRLQGRGLQAAHGRRAAGSRAVAPRRSQA